MQSHSTGELIWVYPDTEEAWTQKIEKEFGIHPVTAQILAQRGFTSLQDIHEHLYAKLPNLHDPYLFNGMDLAVERILKAMQDGEKIVIYGDNDVDGITATALLTEFFRYVKADVCFFIPNRNALEKDKDNVMFDAIDFAEHEGCTLLITVDCGITAADEMEKAKKKGIDVIVTDHHEPTDKLPYAVATLNPKLTNSTYPNRELTGVGVAFKLAHALTSKLVSLGMLTADEIDLKRYLDLVALGTIADMGALLGENRILVRYGLRQAAITKRVGLTKLCHVCEVDPTQLSPTDVASKVAPRLNSLGRIADPQKGVELLLIRDAKAAEELATKLDLNNTERQKIERRDTEDIEKYLCDHPEVLCEKAIVLSSHKWHPGIIPIISARIARQYNRPTCIISIDGGVGKGSLRTIKEFPLLPFLKKNASLFENFGGHNFAAGFSIQEHKIPQLRALFLEEADKLLQEKDILFKLPLDASIDFKEISFDFLESLSLLEPFGNENPLPLLYTEAQQAWAPKIIGKTHLKLYLIQNDRMLEGIAFNMAGRKKELKGKGLKLQVAFTPHVNNYLKKSSIQLQIRDFRVIP